MNSFQIAATCLALAAAGSADAVRLGDMPPPTAEAVRNSTAQTTASKLPDGSNSLGDGTIEAVSEKGDQVQIHGTWLKLADGQTQVFRQGKRVNATALTRGQRVRFSLAAGVDRTTLGLVYVP